MDTIIGRETGMLEEYFYPLTSEFACYQNSGYKGQGETPVAKHISDRVLTLSIYAGLEEEVAWKVCEVILE